ncbi:Cytochrome P450 monooxygenase otaC-like protein [Cladobotryum mycophilum]|uniref:Cytochrome P450 monooxygenase otaC-like protein n=1 Tax=Cladobotryum mycophilum TaxID=491253 RepID=A0ABR0SW67_9HYPO
MATDTLLIIGTAVVICALYFYVLYPACFSPLAHIPSPHWSCAVSNFWILRVRNKGTENSTLYDAHCRLGNVIRVAPNTLSINGADAVRTVYQGGTRSPLGILCLTATVPCIFSTIGSKEHSRRKRMITHIYSKSYIQSSEAIKGQIRAIVYGRLLPILYQDASASKSYGTEVESIFMATAMDLVSAYIFGLQNGTNFLQDEPYRTHWLKLYLSRLNHHFWPQELPWFTSLCSRLGLRLYPSAVDGANNELRDWNYRLCGNAHKTLMAGSSDCEKPEDEPIVFKALHSGIEKENKTEGKDSLIYKTSVLHKDEAVASEIFDHLLAGHENAGVALTYLTWHLSQSPSLQEKLREELFTLVTVDASGDDILPDCEALNSLPVLNCMVMETLRVHAPIAGPLPRDTPYPSCNIDGHEIPGGVRVAAFAHALHLDETVFPEAKNWDHTRWIGYESPNERQKEMSRQFWAFGSGGRMCVGSHFALNGQYSPDLIHRDPELTKW